MYRFLGLIFCFVVLTVLSCEKSNQQPSSTSSSIETKTEVKKSKKKQNTNKPADSINRQNAIDFLLAYGDNNPETRVRLKTKFGSITIQLYEETLLHRANFIFLTKMGYFDTTCFYRIVPDFIIQGGDSERPETLRYRNRYSNYRVPAEFKKEIKHKFGAVAAARDWEKNPTKESNPFEFYIIQNKKGAHHLDGEHTVFGQVISGFEVIDKIASVKAGSDEWPLDDIFIKAEILK